MDAALDTAAQTHPTRAPAQSATGQEPSHNAGQLAASIIRNNHTTIDEEQERNQ